MQERNLKLLVDGGLVPVFNHSDPVIACRVVQACYDAGLRVFEWTNRSREAAGIFRLVREYATSNCPQMLFGVGSLFDGEACREFTAMGAGFIVSPVLEPEMARTCKELDVLWIPGCGTATEIHQARKWGAQLIKIFPGDAAGGPGFVRAILGPMPGLKLMPTGGVSPDPDNIRAWFAAGVSCVGMGSQLFTSDRIQEQDPVVLRGEIHKVLEIIRTCQKEKMK